MHADSLPTSYLQAIERVRRYKRTEGPLFAKKAAAGTRPREETVSEKTRWVAIVAASFVGVGLGAYYLGFAQSRSASRSLEAAEDLLVPVDDLRRTRVRREGIRDKLERLMERQTAGHVPLTPYLPLDSMAADTVGYIVEVVETGFCPQTTGGCTPDYQWMAIARDRESAIGERCAVALNREPTYLAGIPLKREGRVRCSWDLATRINRFLP